MKTGSCVTPKKEGVVTVKEMIWAAVWRGIRTLAAQLPTLIAYLSGKGTPEFLFLGVAINAAAKFLRDKYGWDWLPV